jgi:hypothetical protein
VWADFVFWEILLGFWLDWCYKRKLWASPKKKFYGLRGFWLVRAGFRWVQPRICIGFIRVNTSIHVREVENPLGLPEPNAYTLALPLFSCLFQFYVTNYKQHSKTGCQCAGIMGWKSEAKKTNKRLSDKRTTTTEMRDRGLAWKLMKLNRTIANLDATLLKIIVKSSNKRMNKL